MRRRYVRTAPQEESNSLLLMAAGALTGAAVGLFLGRRYRTMDAFLDDMRDRIGDLREVWDEQDELEDEDDRETLAMGADFDDIEEDDIEDDTDGDNEADDEDFDEELAAVTRQNGVSARARTAEERARRLEAQVLEAFRDDRVLSARSLEIAVVGEGVVELTGMVRTLEEIPRAAAVTRRVPGVSMVLNRIEVGTGGHVDTASVPREPAVATEPVAPPAPTA